MLFRTELPRLKLLRWTLVFNRGFARFVFWDIVIRLFDRANPSKSLKLLATEATKRQRHDARMFGSIDYVPPSLPIKSGFAKL